MSIRSRRDDLSLRVERSRARSQESYGRIRLANAVSLQISIALSDVFALAARRLTLVHSKNWPRCLVPLPIPNTNTPSANGSRVPPCPTLSPPLRFIIFLASARVWLLVLGGRKNFDSHRSGLMLSMMLILCGSVAFERIKDSHKSINLW
jgi:hypothetical protein